MESVAIKTESVEERMNVIAYYQDQGYKRWPYMPAADFELCVFVIHDVKALMIRTNKVADQNKVDNGYKVTTYQEWKRSIL